MKWTSVVVRALMPISVLAIASTDSLQDADAPQSGYLPNHNINPTLLPGYTITWKKTYNSLEEFYAKPLVWTPKTGGNEIVVSVSNQNIIRLIDGPTGVLLNSRTLNPPFQSVDTNCGDIPNTVGITGTPIIDPATDIIYFFSKGYKGGATGSGTINGEYLFYGINLNDLTNAITPVAIGGPADNDATRYFVAGTVLQRPALAMIGNSVIAGFGGHCDNFNYTGMLVAVSKTGGGQTSLMAMETYPGAPTPQSNIITNQDGGKAGIWQGGMGIAADGNRVFFVTGNGVGKGANGGGIPVTGKKYTSTLPQATVNMGINGAGIFQQSDYFEPYDYQSLNGGDRDFGSSGACLLDPYFSAGGVTRMIVAGGKSGKVYIMDANNLGGFAMGPGGSDAVIQQIIQPLSLLSGVGSYPAEGGFIYFAPSGGPLYAYSFGTNSAGLPMFTLAGTTALTFSGKAVPTITSLNGAPGSAVVWMSDVNQGLVAYNAIPVGGVLQPISTPATGRITKMQRPTFGNACAYTQLLNTIIRVGPASGPLPLVCSPSPIAFGSVVAGTTKTISLTCTAGTAPLSLKGCSTGLATFQCSGIPTTVASGGKFTIPLTFNLSEANIEAARAGGYQVVPGLEGTAVSILSTTGAVETTVQLTGSVVASSGYLVTAKQIDFGGLSLGSSASATVTLTNDGAGTATFSGFAYQNLKATPDPFINITDSTIGNGFSSSNFPTLASSIAPAGKLTFSVTFTPTVPGSSSSLVTFWYDGQWVDVMLVGTASGTLSSSSSVLSSTSTHASSSSALPSSSSVVFSVEFSSSTILASSSSALSSKSSLSSSSSSSVAASSSSYLSSSTYMPSSSTAGPSSNTVVTTTRSSTFITSTTSSSSVPTSSSTGFPYIGCFSDTSSGHALPKLFANNSVTPELCEAYVRSLALKPTPTVLPYYYVEYHRECYGGTSFAWGTSATVTSLYGAHACTDICSGSIGASTTGTAMCGGPLQFNLYAAKSTVSWGLPVITASR